MTSPAPAPVFIHYTANNKTPVEVGPVVSKSKSFRFYKKWDQADTAARCHSNAFKIYDRRRSLEDGHMQKMRQTPGLRIYVINNASPKISDFYTTDTSGPDGIQADVSDGHSVEFFGFFNPTVKGNYTFSLDGTGVNANNHRMWIGDYACHDYLGRNQTKSSTELFPNKYYAVRFQYKNNTGAPQQVNIKARCGGTDVADTHFVSLFKEDGSRFNRNLLYYGLVATNPETDKYHCYFSRFSDTAEIRESLGIDCIERSLQNDLQSDANPSSKVTKITPLSTEDLSLNLVSDLYNYAITKATYRIKPGTQLCVSARPRKICTEPTKDVTAAAQKFATDGRININISAGILNYDYAWGVTLGKGIVTQTVIEYTARLNDVAKQNKTIRVNEKCQAAVGYSKTIDSASYYSDTVLKGSNLPCNNQQIVLGNNGKVRVNGTQWSELDIGSRVRQADKDHQVPNPSWNGPSALNKDKILSTLVSPNLRYKLEFNSGTGKLKGYYAIKATYTSSTGVKYSKPGSPNAFFLYRPNYSELGGRTYFQKSDTELVEVKENQLNLEWPIKLGYGHLKGYPLQQHYMDTSGNCRTICDKSTACGNYVAYGSGQCLIDKTSNVRPAYTTTHPLTGPFTNNKPSIYIKRPIMTSTYRFNPESAGNYSEYTVVPDERTSAGSTPNVGSAQVQSTTTTSTYNSLSQYTSASEGFSDIPPRFSNRLPDAPETSVEEGRIADLQTIMFQQNVLYSVSSIAALSFLVGAIVLARK